MPIFTLEERDRRWEKVRDVMGQRGIDCLIVWGSLGSHNNFIANLRYLTNMALEGYLVFPLRGEPVFFTFIGMRNPAVWVADMRSGHPKYSEAITGCLRDLRLDSAHIGIVGPSQYYREMGFSYPTYLALIDNFPEAKFEDATDIVEIVRMVKSPAEIRCLEIGCDVGDKVIQAIADTAKVGVTDTEMRAKIRETLLINGCESLSMVLFTAGKDGIIHAGQGGGIEQEYPRAIEEGDMVLAEFDAKYLGYQAQFNQPYSLGTPTAEWAEIATVVRDSFNNALKTLKPGITAAELDNAFLSPIKAAGYTYTHPAFHGLGLTLEDPVGSFPLQPTHQMDASFTFMAGMVMEFEPQVVTQDIKKGFSAGCPVLITETGCKLLSRHWKPELIII